MEETHSVKYGLRVIRKWLWLILSLTFGSGIIAAMISFFVLTPEYQSSSQFLVNQNNPDPSRGFSENDIRTNVELINTYKVIIQSPRILDRVAEELKLKLSSGELAKKIDISSAENSQVVTILVSDPNPELAAKIANTTIHTFQKEVLQLMNVDNVNILSVAELSSNPKPVAPNKMLNIAIALVLGAMVGMGIAFLVEYLDNTIKTENDIVKKLQLPVLGVISHVEDKEMFKNQTYSVQEKIKGVVLDGAS